jgi:DNA processing protein
VSALSREARLDVLQLIRTETIGPITYRRLIERFRSPKSALAALPDLAREAGRAKRLLPASRAAVEAELARAEALGLSLVALGEADYPRSISEIPDPPPALYFKGAASLARREAVAIVGARNASAIGRRMARDLAHGLAETGFVIVSGLARGIDGAAHEAALKTGTIAVVAGGIDVIYPPEHADLTARIASEGLIISEAPPGATPTARDFPRRNRLISGLSRGVVVVEAAAKSGTLITARFALEQGRDVFAVPGSPLDPRAAGANGLIRQGATLVENAADIIDGLSRRGAAEPIRDLFSGLEAPPPDPFSESEVKRVARLTREALTYAPLHRDDILREIDAPAGLVLDALLALVLAGEAEEQSGGRFALAPPRD